MKRADKPCDDFSCGSLTSTLCERCFWLRESHCDNQYHTRHNFFSGKLPCSDGPHCVKSFEYKHEKKLTDLVERLEVATKKISPESMWIVVIYDEGEHGLVKKAYGPFEMLESIRFGLTCSTKHGYEWDRFELKNVAP